MCMYIWVATWPKEKQNLIKFIFSISMRSEEAGWQPSEPRERALLIHQPLDLRPSLLTRRLCPLARRETNKPKGWVTRELKDINKPRCGKSSLLLLGVFSFKCCYWEDRHLMRFTYEAGSDTATTYREAIWSSLCFPPSDKPMPTTLKCPKLPVLPSQQDSCSILSLGTNGYRGKRMNELWN